MALNQDINMHWHKKKPITWSAVISGGLIAFGLTFLFNLLTVGLGLYIFSTNQQGVNDLVFNGYVWTLAGGIIILFFAGWKTGKLIKICPAHIGTDPSLSDKDHYHCYHGMTHGFLAWVFYLIISLVFMILVAQASPVTFFKSSFLYIPMSISETVQTATQSPAPRNQAAATNQQNGQPAVKNGTRQNGQTVAKAVAEQASAQVIGLFLLLALGAASCSIGSYLGFLCHKRCLVKRASGV